MFLVPAKHPESREQLHTFSTGSDVKVLRQQPSLRCFSTLPLRPFILSRSLHLNPVLHCTPLTPVRLREFGSQSQAQVKMDKLHEATVTGNDVHASETGSEEIVSEKQGTARDAADMRRLGRAQELRVSDPESASKSYNNMLHNSVTLAFSPFLALP